ncbi:hypothetical protein MC885_001886, partial [Smutsia gigantea]
VCVRLGFCVCPLAPRGALFPARAPGSASWRPPGIPGCVPVRLAGGPGAHAAAAGPTARPREEGGGGGGGGRERGHVTEADRRAGRGEAAAAGSSRRRSPAAPSPARGLGSPRPTPETPKCNFPCRPSAGGLFREGFGKKRGNAATAQNEITWVWQAWWGLCMEKRSPRPGRIPSQSQLQDCRIRGPAQKLQQLLNACALSANTTASPGPSTSPTCSRTRQAGCCAPSFEIMCALSAVPHASMPTLAASAHSPTRATPPSTATPTATRLAKGWPGPTRPGHRIQGIIAKEEEPEEEVPVQVPKVLGSLLDLHPPPAVPSLLPRRLVRGGWECCLHGDMGTQARWRLDLEEDLSARSRLSGPDRGAGSGSTAERAPRRKEMVLRRPTLPSLASSQHS